MFGSYKPVVNSKEEKKPLDTGELQALIDVMPEMRRVEEVLDLFYNKLHEDDKLPQFTNFFSQILANNPHAFQLQDCKGKSQILFDCYRELTLANLYRTEEYQQAYKSLFGRIKEGIQDGSYDQKVLELIDKNCKSRINFLHCCFIAVAIAKLLEIKSWEINFSSELKPTNLDLRKVDFSILSG
jgi:hypothetical protein